jgi:ribulose-phosphate 3-epimerase
MAPISICASFRQSTIPIINPSLTTLSPLLRGGSTAAFIERAQMAKEAGASTLHLDIFDPNYVDTGGKPSNMDIFNPKLARELKEKVGLPVDAHFMVRPSTLGGVEEFKKYLASFGKCVDFMSIHAGAYMMDGLIDQLNPSNVALTTRAIQKAGACAGVVLNPGELAAIASKLERSIDFALAMTVIPGDGGRGFDAEGLRTVRELGSFNFGKLIAVDGAITHETIASPFFMGVRWFVVGSYWFGKEGSYKTLEEMRAAYQALIQAAVTV